ncbi:hypothetical protein WMF30_27310 [Sorangium sp. So ce134]
MLGLTRDWDIDELNGNITDPDHHGLDILIGLTPEHGGGAACGWLGVQVSGQCSTRCRTSGTEPTAAPGGPRAAARGSPAA